MRPGWCVKGLPEAPLQTRAIHRPDVDVGEEPVSILQADLAGHLAERGGAPARDRVT
jgi:hypothetical protein